MGVVGTFRVLAATLSLMGQAQSISDLLSILKKGKYTYNILRKSKLHCSARRQGEQHHSCTS